jgi:hypothetical protein
MSVNSYHTCLRSFLETCSFPFELTIITCILLIRVQLTVIEIVSSDILWVETSLYQDDQTLPTKNYSVLCFEFSVLA